MSGIPVLSFYTVLFASALFLPDVDAQFHNAAALTTLLLHSAYILGTYVFLVVGGNVVWSLRRQVFEARNLGRYRLKRRLASGGMGEVWVAYHPGLKRDVAVKILRNEVQMESENAVPRFEREARATAELMHPNTVRVFDYGATEDGLFYYVMELLEGETVADHVERTGPIPPERAVHIIGQAARALTEAHAKGIVHRDIKPENLFLTSLGGEHDFVKVLDFGIAKIIEEPGCTMTRTGWLLGTPLYMSPEAVSGTSTDARSDVYALGGVLYFLLSGKAPFDMDNPSALVFAQVNKVPPPPSERLGRPLPEDLEAIVISLGRRILSGAGALLGCRQVDGRRDRASGEAKQPASAECRRAYRRAVQLGLVTSRKRQRPVASRVTPSDAGAGVSPSANRSISGSVRYTRCQPSTYSMSHVVSGVSIKLPTRRRPPGRSRE